MTYSVLAFRHSLSLQKCHPSLFFLTPRCSPCRL